MKLEVVHERCQGAGLCALTAPELFDQDDEAGLIVVLDERPQASEQQDAARRASMLCPNSVIQVVDEAG